MQKIWSWIHKDDSSASFLLEFPKLFLWMVVLSISGSYLSAYLFTEAAGAKNGEALAAGWADVEFSSILLETAIIAPAIEEFLFRFLPFSLLSWILWHIHPNESARKFIFFSAVVVTSVLFGYMHGGVANVPIQGVHSIVLALIFLRWSDVGESCVKGWFFAALMHGLWNAVIVSVAFLFGGI